MHELHIPHLTRSSLVVSNIKKPLPFFLILVSLVWPIYWVPYIPLNWWVIIKNSFLFLLLFSGLLKFPLRSHSKVHFQSYFTPLFTLLFIVVITALPANLIAADIKESLFFYLRFPLSLLIFYILVNYFICYPPAMEKVLKILPIPVLVSSVLIVLKLTGVYHFSPPDEFIRAYGSEGFLMGLSYRSGGLAWTISFVVPILVYYSINEQRMWNKILWAFSLALTLLICSLSLGRGGFITSLLSGMFVYLLILRKKSLFLRLLFIILIAAIIVIYFPKIVNIALFRNPSPATVLEMNDLDMATIDKLSTGRLTLYQKGIELISFSPLLGSGFSQSISDIYRTGIFHNLFINHFVQAGIISGLALIGFFLSLLIIIISTLRRIITGYINEFYIVPIAMILAHFPTTFVEGGVMFSNLYLGITFWYALASLVLQYPTHKSQGVYSQHCITCNNEMLVSRIDD